MELKLLQQLDSIIRQIARDELIQLLKQRVENNNTEFSSDNIASSRIGWLKGENLLIKFHDLLISHGFIGCEFEIFKSHFLGSTVSIDKIVWLTYTNRLAYLFDQLIANKFIPENNTIHQLLTEHFLDKRTNELKNGCLRSLLNEIRNNKRIQIIENILDSLKKIKKDEGVS